MITISIFAVIAYLIGSLSSAIIVCQALGLPDPRTQGSNNHGATNVLRIGGKKAAIITLLGDVLKGTLPVVLAHMFGLRGFELGFIAIAAFLGHLFPIYFNFKGGKGVATAFGVLLGLSWFVGLLAAGTWVIVALVTRYSSLAALITAILAPFYIAIFSHHYGYIFSVLIIVIILLWRHLPNIQRLRAGTESKIKF